ncbi:hypothetical protein B0J11DRAFT_529690 [Dendryphion nanum]|uniref:DUF7892 domain-containing protein n=1 Tax=Dendryphion nanum TaxID=256645 RepID=A0A9P9DRF2_9PLEO|nr:hypothetical protein B0J11DRAFT_529690 [Dendryphion nanum]
MKTAENWERWEVKFQWWRDHQEPKQSAPIPSLPGPVQQQQQQPTKSPPRHAPSPIIHAPVPASKYKSVSFSVPDGFQPSRIVHCKVSAPTLTNAATVPQFFAPAPHYVHPRPPTIPPAPFTPQPGHGTLAPSARTERNLADANEAKATRKLEIERRCQQLNPPIPPSVLRHMDSFKAAIVISTPLSDHAWNILEPRLVAQFAAAQQAEQEHNFRLASLSTRAIDRRQQDASLKEVKEVLDREWEESQRPIREKLSTIADEFINQDWDHGRAVTYDNSPKFAVDLLKFVRQKFYDDVPQENEPLPNPSKQYDFDPAETNEDRRPKLVLENMKWVYDNKLKPLTEQFRKELFLCNGCEGNAKFYGFEGVIQHYGAKHTNHFSVGNVVVAWREAEWPEDTPFHPDPISMKHAFHTSGQGSNYGNYYSGYSRAETSTPHGQPHLPQASPGPYHYGGHYNGPFAPPQAPSGYSFPNGYAAPMDSYSPYQSIGTSGFGPQQNNNSYMASPALTHPTVVAASSGPQHPHGTNEPSEVDHRTSSFDKQVSTIIEMAQDIWKQTSGIKDLPNSLRIYVLLHSVISKFQFGFNHEPNLSHFIDAFSNHQIPRALKHAPGLSCKACQDELSHRSAATRSSSTEERRTYTALNLFLHFQSYAGHQTQGYGSGHPASHLDWKEDMIELPSDRFISGLIHAPGMDDDKLHMVATVFPSLFPTPLPRIGTGEHVVVSPTHSGSKDSKDVPRTGGTPGLSTEKSGPSSLASPYTDSPRPPKPSEDEYDPQRPAIAVQSSGITNVASRRRPYRPSPPSSDLRQRYYAQPQYYLTRDSLDDEYPGPQGFLEIAATARRVRESGAPFEEHPTRRSFYPEHEDVYYDFGHENPSYGSRDQRRDHGNVPQVHRHIRYVQEDDSRPGFRVIRAPQESGSATDQRGLGASSETRVSGHDPGVHLPLKPPATETDPEDGSRYTPPPPNPLASGDQLDPSGSFPVTHHVAPSTVSNGSRHEDHRPGRHVPTPDSTASTRRNGPQRRRERNHDHVPSRYYRYMSVAHEEPSSRGPSVGRSQSRRYERYEEQRRRIDQQETPQPNLERDYDPAYSRDQSVDHGLPDDLYQAPIRRAQREYVPVQDRLQPYSPHSPPRRMYASDDVRGPPPVYVDEYGHPIQEYEIIRVPRESRPVRGTYLAQPGRFYPEHENGHIEYVSYERPPPPREYVYYEERQPASSRRSAFETEGEAPYEAPPDIKVEAAAGSGGS